MGYLSTYYYSVWVHKIENDLFWAYSPQFSLYSVTSASIWNALASLSDLLINVMNRLLEQKFPLPSSETFSSIPSHLLSGVQSPLVIIIRIMVADGFNNKPSIYTSSLISENKIQLMPIEHLRTPVELSKIPISRPEFTYIGLPKWQPINGLSLRNEMLQLVKAYCPDYTIGTVITDRNDIEKFLDDIIARSLKKFEELLSRYDIYDILSCALPQLDCLIYFNARDEYEQLCSTDLLGVPSDLKKKYYAEKSFSRSMVSFGLTFTIDYTIGNPPSGREKLSIESYERLIILAYIYTYCRGLKDRYQSLNTIYEIVICSHCIDERELNVKQNWFLNYVMSRVEERWNRACDYYWKPKHLDNNYFRDHKKMGKIFDELMNDLNVAFSDEFGITYDQFKDFGKAISNIRLDSGKSICCIKLSKLQQYCQSQYGLNKDVVERILDNFSLFLQLGTEPSLVQTKIDPNNPLGDNSIRRRPFILRKSTKKNTDVYVYWGLRSRSWSYHYFLNMLFDAKYFPKPDGKLEKWVSKYRNYQGFVFRNTVCAWFICNCPTDQYSVLKEELNLKKFNKNVGNLGDVDVLVVDKIQHIVYSIECKNISHARKPKDIKTEFDKFSLIEGNNEYIEKHSKRHIEMKNNSEKLKKILKLPFSPKIVSIIITSDAIMAPNTGNVPLPVYSYKDLAIKGLTILFEAQKHPFNT